MVKKNESTLRYRQGTKTRQQIPGSTETNIDKNKPNFQVPLISVKQLFFIDQ